MQPGTPWRSVQRKQACHASTEPWQSPNYAANGPGRARDRAAAFGAIGNALLIRPVLIDVRRIDMRQKQRAAMFIHYAEPAASTGLLTVTTFNVLLALHVLGVVWWIGGVATVTAVLLPMFNRLPAPERLQRIQQFEHGFANQARIAVLIVGISGVWMLALTGGMARLALAYGWWIDLMILVWLLFALMLFVAEPLGLPKRLGLIRKRHGFLLLHAILLTLALATIVGGVIGARGGFA